MVEVYLILFFLGFGNSLLPLYDGTPRVKICQEILAIYSQHSFKKSFKKNVNIISENIS